MGSMRSLRSNDEKVQTSKESMKKQAGLERASPEILLEKIEFFCDAKGRRAPKKSSSFAVYAV